MSTTNPPPGQPTPDDSHGFGRPAPDALARGYEADSYDKMSVWSVPLLVVFFFVAAFAATTWLFSSLPRWVIDYGDAHPQAVERNVGDKEHPVGVNDRLRRINRDSKEVPQPRLEPLRERGPYSRAITSPEEGDNPPYLHPEDVRAEPARTPELFSKAKVPLDTILKAADKNLFPVQKEQSGPIGSQNLQTAANAGRGGGHSVAVVPRSPVLPEMPKNETPPKKDNQPPKGPGEPPKGPGEGGKK